MGKIRTFIQQTTMSKKRGLSAEEKRVKMGEIFYETKEFFLLKELEKIAPKQKGIISQSVKDVLQSLVDDDMGDTEKIGTSVYFWAFPSKATANRNRKLADIQGKIVECDEKLMEVKSNVSSEMKGREPTEERDMRLKYLERMKEKITLSTGSINRWTDNIYAVQSWIGKKFPAISINDLNKQFQIPDDLDYVE